MAREDWMTKQDMQRAANLHIGEAPKQQQSFDQSSGDMRKLLGALLESLTDPKQYAVLGAEARHGLKDLQDMVLTAFPEGFPHRDEPGTIGSPTQQIVTEQIKGIELEP